MKKLSVILGLFMMVAILSITCLPRNVHAEGCDCYIVDYDEYWIDPNNPGSGDHAAAWFQCNQSNYNPIVTTDLPWSGYERDWMVWDNGNNIYQVFVDGSYYWPLRAWAGWEEWEIFYTVHLE